MEVSGKRQVDSDSTKTGILCDPCKSTEETETAEQYCLDCHEFLCIGCAKAHRKMTITKGHRLLERVDMPKTRLANLVEIKCSKHEEEPYKYYCKTDSVLCCSVCLNLEHKQCTVEYIMQLVDRFETSGEYEAICKKIKTLDDLLRELKSQTDANKAATKRTYDKIKSDIKMFRAEINAYIDTLEKSMLDKVDKIQQEYDMALSTKSEEFNALKAELDELSTKIETLSKFSLKKELLITARLADDNLNAIGKRISELSGNSLVESLQFCRNDNILQELRMTGFGSIEAEMNIKEGVTVKSRNVPQSLDKKHPRTFRTDHMKDLYNCGISGSVMIATNKLAVVDNANNSVKIIDAQKGNILSFAKVTSWPWDITYTSQCQLVVTCPGYRTLVFLNEGNSMTLEKNLKVDGECWGIDYMSTENLLVVSFVKPGSVKFLNMNGEVLRSMTNDQHGQPLFTSPHYVTTSVDKLAIYVSDFDRNTVTRLDMTGAVQDTYTSGECRGVRGIAVDSHDNVYLTGVESNTVCILSVEGRHVDKPMAIALCEETGQLFVSHSRESSLSNSLSVYKVHKNPAIDQIQRTERNVYPQLRTVSEI